MPQVKVEELVMAPAAQVWASWADFGNIDRFHPGITGSRLINGSAPEGLGAMRQCDMSANGKQYVRERVTDIVENRLMVIDIFEATVPIKTATATLELSEVRDGFTLVTMTMNFKPSMGLLGAMMAPMMKMQFRKMLQQVLRSNADFVVHGVEISRAKSKRSGPVGAGVSSPNP
ncbi:MAG: SRPBCC family protein [Pseudomonadota bacterium]